MYIGLESKRPRELSPILVNSGLISLPLRAVFIALATVSKYYSFMFFIRHVIASAKSQAPYICFILFANML